MEASLAELRLRLAEIADLERTQRILIWDMRCWMPPAGERARGAQLATLETIVHDRQFVDRIGELLDELEPLRRDRFPTTPTTRAWFGSPARRLGEGTASPTELARRSQRRKRRHIEVWVDARERSDFDSFRPALERMLELKQRYVECFAPYDDPYDALLDDYEPGMRDGGGSRRLRRPEARAHLAPRRARARRRRGRASCEVRSP